MNNVSYGREQFPVLLYGAIADIVLYLYSFKFIVAVIYYIYIYI